MTDSGQVLEISPEIIHSIADFNWVIKALAKGDLIGSKRSKKLGTGMEFSQYRPYSQGDDLRQLDWKMYARSEKFYIKQSEIETNQHIHFVLDTSASMEYSEGKWSKLSFAKLLIGVLGYVALENGDEIGFSAFESHLRPGQGKRHWQRFLHSISEKGTIKNFNIEKLHPLSKRGLIVVVSDLYDEEQEWQQFITNLKTTTNEVIILHLLGDQERSLSFIGPTLFQDLENDQKVELDPKVHGRIYKESFQNWLIQCSSEFAAKGIDYHTVSFKSPVHDIVNDFLARRKRFN